MNQLPINKQLILFDGVCNLCNTSVKYIIKHDKHHKFMFTALQSKTGAEIIKAFNVNTTSTDSILLYSKKNGLKTKSTAALFIAKNLTFPINILAIFLIIPPFIRNLVYDYIAKNRYKWYGKKETCMIPTKALKSRFWD